jgi:hypothetical protein
VYNTISGNKTLKGHTYVSKVIIIDSFAKLGGKWMTYFVWEIFLKFILKFNRYLRNYFVVNLANVSSIIYN